MTTKKVSEVTNDPPPVHIPVHTPDNDRPLWIAIRSALLGVVSAIEAHKLGMVCKHVKLTGKEE